MNIQTAFIVVAVAAAIVALVFVLVRRDRTAGLKRRLSSEYERVLAAYGKNAESVLAEREKRASSASVGRLGVMGNHRRARGLALRRELGESWTEDLPELPGYRGADDGMPYRNLGVPWRSRRSSR